jgi:hypothetical protein
MKSKQAVAPYAMAAPRNACFFNGVTWVQRGIVNAALSGLAIDKELPVVEGRGRRRERIVGLVDHRDEIAQLTPVELQGIGEFRAVIESAVGAFDRLLRVHVDTHGTDTVGPPTTLT